MVAIHEKIISVKMIIPVLKVGSRVENEWFFMVKISYILFLIIGIS